MKLRTFLPVLALLLLLPCLALCDSMVVHITAFSADAGTIGENWTAAYTLDGYELTDGMLFDIPRGKITLGAVFSENDSSPDVGSSEITVNMTDSRLAKGYTCYQDLTATEDKGHNRGVTVLWTIEYDFIPVGSNYVLVQ